MLLELLYLICVVAVCDRCLCNAVSWVDLQSVFVAFPGHTHLILVGLINFYFVKASRLMVKELNCIFLLKHYVYSVSNFRPLGLCQEANNWINVVSYISIDNGDVAHNINPVICFLTKAKWPKIETEFT